MPEIQVKDKLITLEELGTAINAKAGVTSVNNQTGAVNLIPENIGALASAGGTVTGNIIFDNSDIDASKADNGLSAYKYPTTFFVRDKENRMLARLESQIGPNGNIGSKWYVRNYDTSGNQVGQKGIAMTMTKTGNLSYTFDDAANARFALGITPENIGAAISGSWGSTGNLDNLHTTGLYYANGASATGFPKNDGKVYGGVINISNSDGTRTIQIAAGVFLPFIYYRRYAVNDGGWTAWSQVTLT